VGARPSRESSVVMGKLRDRMRDDLRLRNYSERTIKGYLLYAKKFVAHFMRPPEQITRDEVRAYLLYLMNERGLAGSTYRQYRAAIKFLYEVTLGLPFEVDARTRRILVLRGQGWTLARIGQVFGITREWVRQIVARARQGCRP
jgi:hypothetical protein